MDLQGKKVLVIGTGISGIGAVKLLSFAGAAPILYDENKKLEEAAVRNKLPAEVNAEIVIGSLPKELEEEIVLVVPSPAFRQMRLL